MQLGLKINQHKRSLLISGFDFKKKTDICDCNDVGKHARPGGDEPAGLLDGHAQAQAAPTVKVAERLITLNVNGRQA